MRTGLLAQGGGAAQLGNPYLNIGIFLAFVVVTLFIVYRVSRSATTASDYYAAGSSFTGPQNGVAISGDYLSAASFLGIAGAIAVNGYDGFLYSIGFLVAWLTALLLVAELLRNVGRFTLGDVLAFRMKQRPVRAAAAVSTLLGVGAELGADSEDDLTRALRRGSQDTINQTGQQIVRRQLNVPPTLTVRPGHPLRVVLTRDLVLEPMGATR